MHAMDFLQKVCLVYFLSLLNLMTYQQMIQIVVMMIFKIHFPKLTALVNFLKLIAQVNFLELIALLLSS